MYCSRPRCSYSCACVRCTGLGQAKLLEQYLPRGSLIHIVPQALLLHQLYDRSSTCFSKCPCYRQFNMSESSGESSVPTSSPSLSPASDTITSSTSDGSTLQCSVGVFHFWQYNWQKRMSNRKYIHVLRGRARQTSAWTHSHRETFVQPQKPFEKMLPQGTATSSWKISTTEGEKAFKSGGGQLTLIKTS